MGVHARVSEIGLRTGDGFLCRGRGSFLPDRGWNNEKEQSKILDISGPCIDFFFPGCFDSDADWLLYAFTDWNGIVGSEITFVGFRNFIEIFTRDSSFMHAFGFTALFSICAVVLVNIVGFALALLVTQKFRGATLLRGIFFMPNLIGGLLLGFTWQFIFVSIFGAISKATRMAGTERMACRPGHRICGTSDSDGLAVVRLYDDCIHAQIQQIPGIRERSGPHRRSRV